MAKALEEWRPVVNYEGLYEVSSYGRVRSLPRNTTKGKILSPYMSGRRNLDPTVKLHKNGTKKHMKISRLVCTAFHDNPKGLPEVNHKDENPLNNNAENLEWCDRKYNNNYGTAIQRRKEKLSKKVINKTTGCIYPSITEASIQTGISKQSISRYCLKQGTPKDGTVWEYLTE